MNVNCRTPEEVYRTFGGLFESMRGRPDTESVLAGIKMTLLFRFTDPEAVILVNMRRTPYDVRCGKSAMKPDVELSLTAGTAHGILTGEETLADAVRSNRIRIKGSFIKVLNLAPLWSLLSEEYRKLNGVAS